MVRCNRIVVLLGTVAATACAGAPLATSPPAERVEEAMPGTDCSISVVFGSFATGPDAGAMQAVSRTLAADPEVTAVTRSPSGREGEHSLCIQTAERSAATRVFNRLISQLREPVAAPVSLFGPGGEVVVIPLTEGRARR